MKEEKLVIHRLALLSEIHQDRDFSIVQIGCGGTGSALVPLISRHLYDINQRFHRHIDYIIMDGDIVEKKNIARQNFIDADLGRNKAEVLADRYSSAFGIGITAIPKYLPLNEEMDNILNQTQLIISCVDNNKTRTKIDSTQKYMQKHGYRNSIWIDVGNELSSGQVFISGRFYDKRNGQEYVTYLTDIHPEVANSADKHPDEVSCAERAMSGEQSLAVNTLAAILVFNTITELSSMKQVFHYELMFSTNGSTRKKYGDDYEKDVIEAKKLYAKSIEDAKKEEEARYKDEIWEVPVQVPA